MVPDPTRSRYKQMLGKIPFKIDSISILITSFRPSKLLILLVVSCLLWIGIISFAITLFTGSGLSAVWIIAGVLLLATLIWVVVMFREFQNAIEIPEYFPPVEREARRPVPVHHN
jgi:fatty acid desaturase